MSSKSKKTTVTSSSSFSASSIASPTIASTPIAAGSSSTSSTKSKRASSPMSPTRQSRLQEKQDLQNLNDRLANYIDRVRHLESENSRLSREIHTSTETVTREVNNIKSMYEHELSDARKLLDDTAREKAKLEIDMKRLYDENEDLKKRLDKKIKDCNNAENSARLYESRASELSNKYNTAVGERKKAQEQANELADELEKIRKLLGETRKAQEEETLCRIDLENTLQSLKEELMFKDQIYQQELTETRSRKQVEISEIDGRLAQQYEQKLQQSLQELREQQEAHVRANREELENRYENKLKALSAAANRNSSATGLAVEELRSARLQVDGLNSRLSELETQNNALNKRCRDLEKSLQGERALHAADLAQLEDEISRLRDEMGEQLKEYAALMDIKTSLDLEIATYRALLEGEEDRLNLTGVSEVTKSSSIASMRRDTPVRSARKRVLLEESEEHSMQDFSVMSSAKGDIEISEVCSDGTFVKIHNKGKKEVVLSGWQILRKAGSLETVFKFHRSVKLEPGATTTVWSADTGHEHEPPLSIVMKGQKWFVNDTMTTHIINSNHEEVAVSVRKRNQLSTSASRHRETQNKLPRHQLQGENGEQCSIM